MRERYFPAPTPQYALEAGPVLLKDGRTATLRPATKEDLPLFVEFLSRLSPEARKLRFFNEVSAEAAAELLLKQPKDEEKVTLVVLSGEPERIIATGEYVQEGKGSDSSEVAFLVDDWFQGKGLGSLLLERLALIAARRGIRRFHAYTLAHNQAMLDVFKASGFNVKAERDSGEVEVEFEIEPSEKTVAQFELRERVSTVASLLPFFRPRGVAVVGASREAESVGYRVLDNLVRSRFQGPVYPVNPEATPAGEVLVVGSILAYPSVKAIPGPVDLAVIATPPNQVVNVAEACGERGVRALVVLTVGLSPEQIHALSEVCRSHGMRIVGPGSLGIAHTHPEIRLAAGLVGLPPRGRIALSSQSGSLGLAVLEYAAEMGLGISSFVSLGAKADVSSNDLIQFWEDDPETALILLYLESFGNPRRFARLARRVGRKKPVLAVRPGRDTVVEALFQQAGVIRAESLEEMFDAAALLAHQPLPKFGQGGTHRVALLTNASGPGNLALEALRLAGRGGTAKPVNISVSHFDLGSGARPEDYAAKVAELLADTSFESLMLLLVPMAPVSPERYIQSFLQALQTARASGCDKTVLACFMTGGRPRVLIEGEWIASSEKSGNGPGGGGAKEQIPVYRFPESAARALALAVEYARWRAKPEGSFPDFAPKADEARNVLEQAGSRGLTAAETEKLLLAFGLKLGGDGPEGLEALLSVDTDPLFGPALSLSLVGLPLGPMRLATRITPLTDLDALELLEPLSGKADLGALQELVLRVSQLVEELPELSLLELRLVVSVSGVLVQGARLKFGQA